MEMQGCPSTPVCTLVLVDGGLCVESQARQARWPAYESIAGVETLIHESVA